MPFNDGQVRMDNEKDATIGSKDEEGNNDLITGPNTPPSQRTTQRYDTKCCLDCDDYSSESSTASRNNNSDKIIISVTRDQIKNNDKSDTDEATTANNDTVVIPMLRSTITTTTANQSSASSSASPPHFPVSSGWEHQRLVETGDDSGFNKFQGPSANCCNNYPPTASIQDLVKRRSELLRQLEGQPNNYLAQLALDDCDSQINHWALANRTPGVFYGSTDAPVCSNRGVRTFEQIEADALPDSLSRKQYTKNQPWFSKKMLTAGTSVVGRGKKLLMRLGWREGCGLGKRCDGPSEPVVLLENLRSSNGRRGLSTDGESFSGSNTTGSTAGCSPTVSSSLLPVCSEQTVDNNNFKHPVTELTKYCAKSHFQPPAFVEVLSSGPAHRPQFLMKVCVSDVEYQPTQPSPSKKEAKKDAAMLCLQTLGLWSSDDAMRPFLTQKWLPASDNTSPLSSHRSDQQSH